MKKSVSILLVIVMCFCLIACAQADELRQTLIMTINSPTMTVDGVSAEVDPGRGTAPIISNDRTILPVRAVIEALDGAIEWDEISRTATLTYGGDAIDLAIDSTTAYFNGEPQTLDVAPVIIDDRTYLPIRFIAERFNWGVEWNETARTVTITRTYEDASAKIEEPEETPDAEAVHTNEFDLEKGVVLLNNGLEMPIIGIGTFTLTDEQAEDSVYWALSDGYRLIDTATAYNNEEGVGRGIKRAIDEGIVNREDIFVTTKLWPSAYNSEGIDACLEKLGLEYVDLMLLHQPMGDYIAGYRAMEQAVAEGKIKSVGLSNFNQTKFGEIMEIATIPPAINQVETHPYYQESEMIEFLDQYGTVIEAWFPLGGRGHTQELFDNETIAGIAEAHDKSSAQIILRWHLQAGHIAIPGSNNPDHIQENIELFDFELTDEEMEKMRALDTGEPYFKGFSDQSEAEDAADRWGLNVDGDAE
ncbi:MAG: aldo/keto reductase [Oscillospiraceae bacterium]|nr:aldo/keto reductase [Oscillospiraceae bacterium]